MKIAVIGASGFVGNYILTELKKNKNLKIIATFNKNKIYGNDKKIIYKKLDIEKKKNFYKYLNKPEIIIIELLVYVVAGVFWAWPFKTLFKGIGQSKKKNKDTNMKV